MTQEMQNSGGTEVTRKVTFTPRVDIYTSSAETVLLADMPGVDEKSADAYLADSVLTISGKRQIETPAGFTAVRAENPPTDYKRVFEISQDVDRSKIKASVKNGVLRVVLPMAEHTKPRKIEINTN